MGSDESHFNISLIVRDTVTRQCPRTTAFLKTKEGRAQELHPQRLSSAERLSSAKRLSSAERLSSAKRLSSTKHLSGANFCVNPNRNVNFLQLRLLLSRQEQSEFEPVGRHVTSFGQAGNASPWASYDVTRAGKGLTREGKSKNTLIVPHRANSTNCIK